MDASFLKRKIKFKITASLKAAPDDSLGAAGIWVSVINKNGEVGSFANTLWESPVKTNEWKTDTLEGTMDENTEKLEFGGVCHCNGKFYFDDFQLYVEMTRVFCKK